MIERLREWWEDHHCIICGLWIWKRKAYGAHWSCERPLWED